MISNENRQRLSEEILQILESNIGHTLASMYKEFYKDKDSQTIFASASELLEEFIGHQKQREIMYPIRSKYFTSDTS